MKPEKRSWLYDGIGATPGLALVSNGRREKRTKGHRLLLIGGTLARSISAPLERLAREYRAAFRCDFRDVELGAWATNRWLSEHQVFSPTTVILDFDPRLDEMSDIAAQVREIGGTDFWLDGHQTGMINGLTKPTMHLPLGEDRMTPTAAGYAGWASAVWRAISSR